MTLARKPWKPGAYSTIKPSAPRATKREADPVTAEIHAAVMNRDRGCLLRGTGKPCGGRIHWHHRVPVEHGGPSIVANGATLCTRHHSRVHNVTPETEGRGLLLKRGADPRAVPVTLRDGRRAYLTDDGEYREAA